MVDKKDTILFDIRGTPEEGLDKSILNALRRTIISDIPCVAFRVERNNNDLIIKKNSSSLHNEYIEDRISMIPLSINPETYYRKEGSLIEYFSPEEVETDFDEKGAVCKAYLKKDSYNNSYYN